MENNKNNETQNRREFFKEAAKKALPIIGAVALFSNPVIAKAVESKVDYECSCSGCTSGCYTTCHGSCKGGCIGCKHTCHGSCVDGCIGCKNTCHGTAKK
jgi:hypothetical protein